MSAALHLAALPARRLIAAPPHLHVHRLFERAAAAVRFLAFIAVEEAPAVREGTLATLREGK